MAALFAYHNGTLLQRLTESEHGLPSMVYDRQMLDKDAGEYIRHSESPKMVMLDEASDAKRIYEGDIVMQLMTEKCAIVSPEHAGAILPYNFMHIEVDTDRINPFYFVYWWDWSPEALAQRHQMKQGSSSVQKITARQLQDLHITLPPLDKQQRMGKVNQNRKRIQYLRQKREALMDQYLAQQFFRRNMYDDNRKTTPATG
ncbi:restriction endonuclease subunit S domain-containing protein [Lentibacillus cibarius]|uniref:restriction endonuclease subunit S n=1 Tax=Lentibacillus cibarius TaxID=2583219 RepID=UPI001486B875|nr:restriction endonuclease subunit S [Lentibacillus cibarius]